MKENPPENPYENKCPLLYAMEIIGSKWKLPLLWNLAHYERMHYNELKRDVQGVSNTVLTRCLRELERDGVVSRHSAGSVPPSVTYCLTENGKRLIPALDGLYRWGELQQQGL